MTAISSDTTQTLRIKASESSYDILVGHGLLVQLGATIKALRPREPRTFLVTSPELWSLWSAPVLAGFSSQGAPAVLMVPAGESHKRLSAVEQLAEQLAVLGADRDSLLIAFGGGVIGDITGFLAAIYMRGVDYLQVPTTLLAQVDSSVGGKTGVNLRAGKNLIGSFHHPLAVLADLDVLSTLPDRELRSGLQEVVKAAIIRDSQLFSYLAHHKRDVLSTDAGALAHVVLASIQIKANVVEADEFEAGQRVILNFGHTLGHAIEAATGYGQLLHGEAVGWGSIGALHLGRMRGTITRAAFDEMAGLIHAYGPLPRFQATAAELVKLSAGDKKVRSGCRAFVLPTGIGSVEIVRDVADTELTQAAQAMLDDMSSLAQIAQEDVR